MTTTDDPQPLGRDMAGYMADLRARAANGSDPETPEQAAARKAEERREQWASQLEDLRDHWTKILAAVIPHRYQHARPDHPAVTAWVDQVLADLHSAPSLLLVGPTGTGKTHQAYGAIRAIVDGALANERRPPHLRAVTSADLYAALRPRPSRDHDPEAELQRLCEVSVLMIDDLGSAKVSEWTEEVTYRLINHRYNHCLPSIFTTNMPIKDLREAVGDRIASRLAETATRVTLDGGDRRRTGAA